MRDESSAGSLGDASHDARASPDWSSLETHFGRLVDASPAERAAILATLADDAPALADELRELLASRDAAAEWLTPDDLLPHVAAVAGLGDASASSSGDDLAQAAHAGQVLGAWRLVERLGRGGMGEVWSAERADGAFTMDVAVKLVRRGLDTRDAARRFKVERQVLADLVHPGIARLLDGGTTDDGRPYLVMERVDGEPLDRFCETRALDVPARLQLFAQLCDAVQAAHALGIVHRDLKPGNVLVTRAGEVKLLDFGIAKLLDDERPHAPVETLTGQRLLTPRYASPEQVRDGAITPSSDIFTLGVLLYELLTGRAPHDTGSGTLRELETSICDRDAPPPSSVVEPARREALRGELDTIVLRALAKEPGARYLSVAALADDVRRHLAGAPILARRDTPLERARRFVRLHRALAFSSLATLGVLAAGLVTALVLHARSEGFRGEAEVSAYVSGLAAAEADIRAGRVSEARLRLESLPVSLRGWEWAHLVARLDGSVMRWATNSLYGAPQPVGDGRIALLDCDESGALCIVLASPDGTQREILLPLELDYGAIAVDPSASRVVVAAKKDTLAAVDLASGAVDVWRPMTEHGPLDLPQLAFAPDGTLALARGTEVELLDGTSGAVLHAWTAHDEQITSICALADGRVVTGASDHLVRIWDRDGGRQAEFTEHTQRVTFLAEDVARGELLSAAADGLAIVHRLADGAVTLRVDCGGPVHGAALIGDDLWTAAEDDVVRRWERASGRLLARQVGVDFDTVYGCATGIPATPFATASYQTLRAWPADGGDPPALPASIFAASLAFDPTGELLAVDAPNGHLRLWRLPGRTLVWEQRSSDVCTGVAIDAARGRIVFGTDSGAVSLRSLDDGRELARLPPVDGAPPLYPGMLVHVLSDGRIVAAAIKGPVRVWDPDGEVETMPDPIVESVSIVRVGDDPPWCASGHNVALIGLPHDFETALPDAIVGATSFALHPDGRRAAIGSRSKLVLVDLHTGAELASLAFGDSPQSLDFHPDGSRLACASSNGTVRLVDVDAWREVVALQGHPARVDGVRFTPDGKTLVSSGFEGSLRIWATERPVR